MDIYQERDLHSAIDHGLAYFELSKTLPGTHTTDGMLRALRAAKHILRHPEGNYLFSTRNWLQEARASVLQSDPSMPISPATLAAVGEAARAGLEVHFYDTPSTPRGFQDEV